ncbi:hypothetical protein O181_003622 [Austropuccinia psidii MF-1]|uniref:Uncharacterized protein n=1 Tax=Austropuccinia psidii MF-1 TaxID=1389203 RepID=A0A9Q3BF58_9BASI|nr:hypothetical protein [Austropuccinia psidii MF-1]
MLRKNRTSIFIGEESLGIKGNDMDLYLDVQRPYPEILKIPPHPAILETRKYIQNNINGLLQIDLIRNIVHNGIVEVTSPGLIPCPDRNSRVSGYLSRLNNYTKADRNPKPGLPHDLYKL